MQSDASDTRPNLASINEDSSAPVSAEYERALLSLRVHHLEEENQHLLDRVVALETYRDRNSSKPPDFEVTGPNGWRIRGKQIVGVAMALTSSGVAIAYLLLRK